MLMPDFIAWIFYSRLPMLLNVDEMENPQLFKYSISICYLRAKPRTESRVGEIGSSKQRYNVGNWKLFYVNLGTLGR